MGTGASVASVCDALSKVTTEELMQNIEALDRESRSKLQSVLEAVESIEAETPGAVTDHSNPDANSTLPSDSAGFLLGQYTEAHSLKAADLNGRRGLVVGFKDDRICVRFAEKGEKALRPSNLQIVQADSLKGFERLSVGKSVAALRSIIEAAGFPWKDCVEKGELQARALQAMDACRAAREVAEFGKALPKRVSLTVVGIDGGCILGPQAMSEDTLVSDIMQQLAATRAPQPVQVKLLNGDKIVDGASCLSDVQVDGVVEFQCMFSLTVLTETFTIKDGHGESGITEINIMPCENQEDFLGEVDASTAQSHTSSGRDFLAVLMDKNIMQLCLQSKPIEARQLKELIESERQVFYLETEARVDAFFARHRLSAWQDYTARRKAQEKALKAKDLEKIESCLASLFG